ncbi:MAG: hypothetical protein ABIS06_06835 [Vicinamibacterales bacterium]
MMSMMTMMSMMSMMRTHVKLLAASTVLLMPAVGNAQTPAAVAPVVAEGQAVAGKMMAGAVAAKTTVGRPYSAETVTELVQALADGNRIATRNVSRVYRDGEGRTRREMINASGAVQAVSISDPIARTSFTLEPETKTAYSAAGMVTLSPTLAAGGGGRGRGGAIAVEGQSLGVVRERSGEPAAVTVTRRSDGSQVPIAATAGGGRGGFMRTASPDNLNVHREELAQQVIEGVAATGTRTTTTIPAGTIGNAQEIRVISEQWFSPDLQVLVMTRHSDPRSGENTYKLTNIVGAEPDPSLFVVPPDYTVKARGVRQPQ